MSRYYRFRVGERSASGRVFEPKHDVIVKAIDDAEAISAAKDHRISTLTELGDYAWLTDDVEKVIWWLKYEEWRPQA